MRGFRAPVDAWFQEVFAAPTPVQEATWQAVGRGEHCLVVAPTGSGKTLAAFLWALDRLTDPSVEHVEGVRVVYVSPLKALGTDVARNLSAPLVGIRRMSQRMGVECAPVRVAVRSGDTPGDERARINRHPPDILVTTPESLYLMLTSSARQVLEGVETVIVDEVHAVAGSKRGSHLALSLERLDALVGHDVQRIGLSATVRPTERVASFLGGDRPVRVVAPAADKRWDVRVRVPVTDMTDLAASRDPGTEDDPLLTGPGTDTLTTDVSDSALPTRSSIWPHIEREVLAEVMAGRSTLVFVNSRRTAERLTSRLNELWAAEHDPAALNAPGRRPPAQLMAPVDVASGAQPVIARAHHGSVSRQERTLIEEDLRSGELRCVVATSSLELGIDMGLVDRVVQVESPPSVSSAVQRIGRAGHAVGAVSAGSVYPKTRLDLLHCAVVTQRMVEGRIEEVHVPADPLDVLAQQTLAQTVANPDGLDIDEWFRTVRRAGPYADLDRVLLDRVVDMLTGEWAAGDMSDLRPRLTREGRILHPRRGALRVATTSGGTIPDRGAFGVFLVGAEQGRRVGELDEEMVYESRVGDVFTLGASSWRIAEITRDQVLVTPAPGHTGRLPFWHGDGAGRPTELGRAIGEFTRRVAADESVLDSMALLDDNSRTNIRGLLRDQQEATGVVADDTCVVMERFRDEVGDWRLVVHSVWGRAVNSAWALAIGQRVRSRYGVDPQISAGDDGMVLRLPDSVRPPGADLLVLDPDEVVDVVTAEVGGSALFAARFRECASRALLLPRNDPRRRAPLWQQRLRASQLLDRVRDSPDFPILLETARECLSDVHDLPGLSALMSDIASGRVRIAEVTTPAPSPMASTLLFDYVGGFVYAPDQPLAARAGGLNLDPDLLSTLMGSPDLRDLLDPQVVEEVVSRIRCTDPQRRARDGQGLVALLARIGPVRTDRIAEHVTAPGVVEEALSDGAVEVRIGGEPHLAAVTDLALLRDGLGVPVPPGFAAGRSHGRDPVVQLVSRWVRAHGPFQPSQPATELGLPVASVVAVLEADPHVVTGRFCSDEVEYCDEEVLRRTRSAALARARRAVAAVDDRAFAAFTLDWHQVAAVGQAPSGRGADGVLDALDQLAGAALPASAWEGAILPIRVRDYTPAMLDELLAAGEVVLVGAGRAAGGEPLLMLLPTDRQGIVPSAAALQGPAHDLAGLLGGGSMPLDGPARELGLDTAAMRDLVWGMVADGQFAPDAMAPVRARISGVRRRAPVRTRARMSRRSLVVRTPGLGAPDLSGRWHLVTRPDMSPTERTTDLVAGMLDRHGVLTRGAVLQEGLEGGFSAAYQVLSGFEQAGKVLRGYFVDGLGGAQFATGPVVDRLRSSTPNGDERWTVLAACDPANPWGASLPWPDCAGTRPSRAPGSLVVVREGVLVAHISASGRALILFTEDPGDAGRTVRAVADFLTRCRAAGILVERINGESVHDAGVEADMRRAGARLTPRGLRIEANDDARG